MIKIESTQVFGWEAAIRGMRNPMNSWDKSDSIYAKALKEEQETQYTDNPVWYEFFANGYIKCSKKDGILENNVSDSGTGYISKDDREDGSIRTYSEESPRNDFWIGPADQDLMMRLARAGSVDAKYRRMINVTVDITAPLYWWKEFDTYKVGTVANSCSTMHKIHAKEFTLDDFSCEYLLGTEAGGIDNDGKYKPYTNAFTLIDDRVAENSDGEHKHAILLYSYPLEILKIIINELNNARYYYLKTKDKTWWWQMIQLLPSSYNQKRTVQLNYEVLAGLYPKRKNHKLTEWIEFCNWIEKLPYSEVITLNG